MSESALTFELDRPSGVKYLLQIHGLEKGMRNLVDRRVCKHKQRKELIKKEDGKSENEPKNTRQEEADLGSLGLEELPA